MVDRDASLTFSSPLAVPPLIAWAMEGVLLLMAVSAPWMYGAVHPGFELVLDVGLALLLLLWALRMVWQWQIVLVRCPVTVLLAVLLLLGLWQITPLPDAVLRTVAPSTADLYDRLLPTKVETLPDAVGPTETMPPEHTLSVAPKATRAYCFRLLAVLLVFLVVRNNLATTAVLMRLSAVLVANGFALCLFAVIQRLTSPSNMLYWTYPSLGNVFGPFVSRNMFPYYVNMCIGLGIGLILARANRQPLETTRPHHTSRQERRAALRANLSYWLHDSTSLWLVAAVAFMASTVAFSLSRGGFAALLGGLLFTVFLGRTARGRGLRVAGLALIAGLALFFLAWLGTPLVEARLRTLAEIDKVDQARVPLWLRVLPLVPEFSLWGTGLGTFQYVELWTRQDKAIFPEAEAGNPPPLEVALFDHAHNDYVEIAVEAGVPGLVVLLAVIFLVFRYGLRAVRVFHGGRRAGLATGILCGLTAVVIHSFVDFGMHAPAIAFLATVLAAMVAGLGSQPAHASSSGPPVWRLRLVGLAPLLGGAAIMLLGLMLCAHTWRAHRLERLHAAAAHVPADAPQRRLLQLPYLEAAARLAPRDAAVRLELAQAHIDLLRAEIARAEQLERLGVFADSWLAPASLIPPTGAGFSAIVLAVSWDAHWVARNELLDERRLEATRKHFYIALSHAIAARNANPLMPEPHLTLGLYAQALRQGDSQGRYFDRVKFLAPRLPEVWYHSGMAEFTADHHAEAWKDWRVCLSLTDRFLDLILFRAAPVLKPQELIDKVLPERAEPLVKAAGRLFPREDQRADRQIFYEAALGVLKRQTEPLSPGQLRLKMRLDRELGHLELAQRAAQQLLGLEPMNYDVRLELAEIYFAQAQYDNAMRELRAVHAASPGNEKANKLLDELKKKGIPR
jgi:O-antigen ligase/tetratricopeptide (TPR) repeat protein